MFTKDSRTENFLTSLGVTWKYTNSMAYAKLAPNWREANLGRPKAKVDDAVLCYAEQMEGGSAAPAPIIWTEDCSPLDGVQRLSAGELRGYTTFSAYLVETDSEELAQAIRIIANQRLQGSYQESEAFTMQRAIDVLIAEVGWSVEQVAALGGWKPAKVAEKKLLSDWKFAIRKIGGPEKITDGCVKAIASQAKLHDFHAAHEPIADFLNDLVRAKFTNGDSEPYINDFFANVGRKKNLHDIYKDRLEGFREDDEVAARLANPKARRYSPTNGGNKISRSLKSALTAIENVRDSGERIVYVDEFMHTLRKIERVLKEIQEAGKVKR